MVKPIDETDPNQVKKYVEHYFANDPILADIARCESDFRQYTENGELLRGKIDNNDVGVMQINERYHLKKSQDMGHDIHTLDGNLAYAKWLYGEMGSKPWKSSSACWGHHELAQK